MKKILLISPHFPPSNLAAVHRSRLFARHLPALGWEPIILTVHEQFYEEKLDWNMVQLLPSGLRVEKTNAFAVTRPRLVGDIGLRGFWHLYRKAKALIRQEEVAFLYIPIPSFYAALLGRLLHRATGVKYGIDYIDPWVHRFPGSEKRFSRHWWSTQIAQLLEPIAVKKASVITGVAEGYYKGVKERNPHLLQTCVFGAMPYGSEKEDHEILKNLSLQPYLFEKKAGKFQLVYAGAMLPKAYQPLAAIFQSIKANKAAFEDVEFHFIGTGKTANDPRGYNIKALAEEHGLWQTVVFEYPARIPYLDVLVHLAAADGVFILGSTEPHYTPSKVYQGVLSQKPILAVLHEQSTAVAVLEQSKAGVVLSFDGEKEIKKIAASFLAAWQRYHHFYKNFDPANIHTESFDQYSARAVTMQLKNLLEKAMALPV